MSDADIGDEEVALVTEVLRSRALSCGPMLERFERGFAERIGARFAVAVSSGTAGLHLALIAAGVAEGDLVVTTPYSFVASANAVLYQRAIPVFVDIDPATLNIDPDQVQQAVQDLHAGDAGARRWLPRKISGRPGRVRAIVPVHVFGQPAAMDPILSVARDRDLAVIEDACEAIAGEYRGRAVGTLGDASVFGFFPNKQMTTGEGGIVATGNAAWASLFRSLRNQGRDNEGAWLAYSRLGFNYRLDDMSAALGVAQLRRLGELLDKRGRVAAAYTERLSIPGVTPLPIHSTTTRRSWFVYVVRFDPEIDRDAVMRELADAGIPSRPYFPSIHLQPFYREHFGFQAGDFPHAEAASRATLALPFHPNLSVDAVDFVAERLAEAVRQCRRDPAHADAGGRPC
jgi:dTDP-4-amino-4,6-dideoxygalactose transaminase